MRWVPAGTSFGFVRGNLTKAGAPLPVNDLWLRAHRIETGSPVVTYDTHFKKIVSLRLWDLL
jgi:tRNA(fMet)-specific endonuclease VapC